MMPTLNNECEEIVQCLKTQCQRFMINGYTFRGSNSVTFIWSPFFNAGKNLNKKLPYIRVQPFLKRFCPGDESKCNASCLLLQNRQILLHPNCKSICQSVVRVTKVNS